MFRCAILTPFFFCHLLQLCSTYGHISFCSKLCRKETCHGILFKSDESNANAGLRSRLHLMLLAASEANNAYGGRREEHKWWQFETLKQYIKKIILVVSYVIILTMAGSLLSKPGAVRGVRPAQLHFLARSSARTNLRRLSTYSSSLNDQESKDHVKTAHLKNQKSFFFKEAELTVH